MIHKISTNIMNNYYTNYYNIANFPPCHVLMVCFALKLFFLFLIQVPNSWGAVRARAHGTGMAIIQV